MNINKLMEILREANDIAGDAPDINIANYNNDQVATVNDALNCVYTKLDLLIASLDGFVIVPAEPTDAMKRSACLVPPFEGGGHRKANGRYVKEIYKAMLSTKGEEE